MHDRSPSRRVQLLRTHGFYCDGGGLYPQVSKSGTKSWVCRYALKGRKRDMGLGLGRDFHAGGGPRAGAQDAPDAQAGSVVSRDRGSAAKRARHAYDGDAGLVAGGRLAMAQHTGSDRRRQFLGSFIECLARARLERIVKVKLHLMRSATSSKRVSGWHPPAGAHFWEAKFAASAAQSMIRCFARSLVSTRSSADPRLVGAPQRASLVISV